VASFFQPNADRRKWVLLALALAEGKLLSPVQLQKTVFLFGELLRPTGVIPGDFYNFVPDNYGPFCGEVYDDIRELSDEGLVSIERSASDAYPQYAATEKGIAEGLAFAHTLPESVQDYCKQLAAWVRAQSFKSLVSAVYRQFPAYRANSIFRE